MTIRSFVVEGKKFDVKRSTRKNKKFYVEVEGKQIHFGARGYRIAPGTKKADKYCARSSGIKGTKDIKSANFWARKMWECDKKKR